MDVKLKVVGGRQAGKELSLPDGNFLIGRAEDCQLRPGSEMISRHHCVFIVEDAYVGIRDFGSKNGTLLNDQRIGAEQEVKNGDRVKIGPLEFEVCVEHCVGGKRRSAVKDVAEVAARTAESSAADSPDDISQWLGEEEPTGAAATQETHTMLTGDTEVIDAVGPDTTEETSDKPAAEEEKPAKKSAKDKHGKKVPGKLPRLPGSSSADSTSAAADILRRMSGRR